MEIKEINRSNFPPPRFLNILIAIVAYSACILLLITASQATEWWLLLLCAVAFSFVGNTVFSLMHESVHGAFHKNNFINYIFGVLSSAFFPTGYTFQRICHLGHHRRNRTDKEMFDMYYPSDNKFLKSLQLYFVLLGVYWTNPPTGALLYTFFPWALKAKFLRSDSPDVQHMSADAMLSDVEQGPALKIRLEILFSLAFQLCLFLVFGVKFWAWLACYWAFAMNWGGLQYADHAWSVRKIREGAWNLKVNKLVEKIFLNYHHHKVHHLYPQIPWIHLSGLVDRTEQRPSFWKVYLQLWKGPTLTTVPGPKYDAELEKLL